MTDNVKKLAVKEKRRIITEIMTAIMAGIPEQEACEAVGITYFDFIELKKIKTLRAIVDTFYKEIDERTMMSLYRAANVSKLKRRNKTMSRKLDAEKNVTGYYETLQDEEKEIIPSVSAALALMKVYGDERWKDNDSDDANWLEELHQEFLEDDNLMELPEGYTEDDLKSGALDNYCKKQLPEADDMIDVDSEIEDENDKKKAMNNDSENETVQQGKDIL